MRLIICLSLGAALLAACEASEPDVSWEAFKAASARQADGRTFYVVEWDLPIATEAELRAYFDARNSEGEVATTTDGLLINTVGGVDDAWLRTNGVTLTYCISNTFNADKARAVEEMDEATTNWQTVTNVSFVYLPNEDASCDNLNGKIDIPVQPWSGGGACAFFPSGGGCVANTLVMDFNDLDTNPFYVMSSPNVTTTGVFRHELGHVLGFRHEHIDDDSSGICPEGGTWRELTQYDSDSVMHYPWCDGVLTSDLSLTTWDKLGSIYVYKLSSTLTSALL